MEETGVKSMRLYLLSRARWNYKYNEGGKKHNDRLEILFCQGRSRDVSDKP